MNNKEMTSLTLRVRQWFDRGERWPALIFFVFTAIYFSPYWLEGKLWAGSTDNLFHMIPNHLFTLMSLEKGSLGLWNPYILTGFDFSTSSHNYVANVFDWPLYLLSRDWFLDGLSLKVALDYFLVGFCSYLFLREEVQDRRWALFGATVYQLGGMAVFAFATHPNGQLFWVVPLTAYWVWSYQSRSRPYFVLGLTFFFTSLLCAMNIAYVFGAFFSLATLILYFVFLRQPQSERRRLIADVAMSLGAMVVLTPWRWYPIGHALFARGSRVASDAVISMNLTNIYYLPRVMLAEVFGMGGESIGLAGRVGASGHVDFHGMPYFGVIPCLLAVLAMAFVPRMRFWSMYFVLAVCWFLELPPVAPLMEFFAQPLIHAIVPKSSIAIPFVVLVASGGKWLEEVLSHKINFPMQKILNAIFITWFLVVSMGLLIWVYGNPAVYMKLKVLWLAVAALFGFLLCRTRPAYSGVALLAMGLISAFVLEQLSEFGILNDPYLFSVMELCSLATFLTVALLLILIYGRVTDAWVPKLVGLFVGICLVLCVVPLPTQGAHDLRIEPFMLGLAKTAAMTLALGALLNLVMNGKLKTQFFLLLILGLTVIDLVPAYKHLGRQTGDVFLARPFYEKPLGLEPEIVRERTRLPLDVENYRLSRLPPNGDQENVGMIYGARMMTGNNSDVRALLTSLIKNFDSGATVKGNVGGDFTNERLLDLMGVRYYFVNGRIMERKTALPRFAFYDDFETVPHQEMLPEVSRPEWNPGKTVLVQDAPGAIPKPPQSIGSFKQLNYESTVPEKIHLKFESDRAGYVLFDDGYDDSWTVRVNGEAEKVVPANHNFMAFPIRGAGVHDVELEFYPAAFYHLGQFSLVMLVLLSALWGYAQWTSSARSREAL